MVIAALAAGLTLGMLSLDPLWLAVKMGRGVSNNNISNESEQDLQAMIQMTMIMMVKLLD